MLFTDFIDARLLYTWFGGRRSSVIVVVKMKYVVTGVLNSYEIFIVI